MATLGGRGGRIGRCRQVQSEEASWRSRTFPWVEESNWLCICPFFDLPSLLVRQGMGFPCQLLPLCLGTGKYFFYFSVISRPWQETRTAQRIESLNGQLCLRAEMRPAVEASLWVNRLAWRDTPSRPSPHVRVAQGAGWLLVTPKTTDLCWAPII